MNNQNPLIPLGSALEQKNRGGGRVKIAVFFVLAIHGIGLMALLMQGCGQSREPALPEDVVETNEMPAFVEPAPPPPETSAPPVAVTAPVVPEPPPPAPPPAVSAEAAEYSIVKGDYLERIARNHHVSVRAIMEANPGIEPTKLQIGQKIRIPAPAPAAASAVAPTLPVETGIGTGEQMYTVKSGDTLIRIARQFGTTPKAISAANNLKTTSIKVGQKLRIPVQAPAPPVAPVAPVETVPPAPSAPLPALPPGA